MIAHNANWFIKLDELKVYDIKCLTFGAELLVFDVWSIVIQLKVEAHALLKLQETYYNKIPNFETYKPTYFEHYNKVMTDKKLRREKLLQS